MITSPDDPELKFLQSLIPDMERAVVDAACEHRKFETRCVQERPYDPVWDHAYKAKVVLMRTIDNLLGTRAEIEDLTRGQQAESPALKESERGNKD